MRRLVLALPLLLLLPACGHAAAPTARAVQPERPVAIATLPEVDDAGFALAARGLVEAAPRSADRANRLGPVVARQLRRAAERFRGKTRHRGLVALHGALSLLEPGELRPELLGVEALRALREGARDYAGRGDEGRSQGLYELLARAGGEREREDAKGHLGALEQWTRHVSTGKGPVQSAGNAARVAIRRRLLEPSREAQDTAAKAVELWLGNALELQQAYRVRRIAPSHDEAGEAFRALQQGAPTLVAVCLLDLDASCAIAALDRIGAPTLVNDDFWKLLQRLAKQPDATDYVDAMNALRAAFRAPRDDGEGDIDGDDEHALVQSALFRVATAAYRLDPTLPPSAIALADGLQQFGMAEASPAVLEAMLRAHPDGRTLSAALGLTLRAMQLEMQFDDTDASRRVFASARPLLELADARGDAARLSPTPARLRAVMGEIELRDGRLAEAQTLLTQAVRAEPTAAPLIGLARVAWHGRKWPTAQQALDVALRLPEAATEPQLRAEALLMKADVAIDEGERAGARTRTLDAVRDLLRVRDRAAESERAAIERLLGRGFERLGQGAAADRALERSLDAAAGQKNQFSATLNHIVGRALLRGDLRAGEQALERALGADLADDDIVYFGLWVRLLERQARVPTSAGVARVFATIPDDGRWVGRLSAFGAGKLRTDELVASAKSPAQRTEALFYRAMELRVGGDVGASDRGLAEVLSAGGVELEELRLARELLRGKNAFLDGPWPADLALP